MTHSPEAEAYAQFWIGELRRLGFMDETDLDSRQLASIEWMKTAYDSAGGLTIQHYPEPPPCRFTHGSGGTSELAVAQFAMSEGCICFPDDRIQDLCAHHANRSEPYGTMEVLRVYDPRWPW